MECSSDCWVFCFVLFSSLTTNLYCVGQWHVMTMQ
jgi:hypothetical protein